MGSAGDGCEVPFAVIGMTMGGVVTLWSDGAANLFDVPVSEAVGAQVVELADWHLRPEFIENYKDFGVDEVWVYRNQVTTRSGQGLVLKSTATVALDASGSEEILVASTAAGPATPADAQRGHVLRPMSGQAELTLLCNEHGKIGYAGSAAMHLFGHVPRQVIGNCMTHYVHPDDLESWHRTWTHALASPGQPDSLTARIRRPDGRLVWAEHTFTNLMDDPAISAVVVNARDVTEHHDAVDLLAATEQTLRSVLGSSVEGVWILDPRGHTVFANARMAELLDVKYADLVNGPVEDQSTDHCCAGFAITSASARRVREKSTNFRSLAAMVAFAGCVWPLFPAMTIRVRSVRALFCAPTCRSCDIKSLICR